MSKNKPTSAPPLWAAPTTRTSVAGKVAAIASASPHSGGTTANAKAVSVSQLVAELSKQRSSLKEDISALIQESIAPLQSSVNALTETVTSFQARLSATEVLAGDNFSAIFTADGKIKRLEEQNATLLERVDDLENRSRRANLRILNVPEDSEKGQYTVKFVSDLLMEAMGEELERAHRSPGQRPREGQPPRPFVVCFQVKEKALRWARTHDVEFNGSKLRIYPDMSAGLAKKRAAFKNVKQLLYEKKIRFSLLHPARLRVQFEDETLFFHSPEAAKVFYDRRVAAPID